MFNLGKGHKTNNQSTYRRRIGDHVKRFMKCCLPLTGKKQGNTSVQYVNSNHQVIHVSAGATYHDAKWYSKKPSSFILGKKIGYGSFGIVYKAIDNHGRLVAIKKMETNRIKSNRLEMKLLHREISNQSMCDHHNIAHIIMTMEHGDSLYMVLEFARGGSLFGHVQKTSWAYEAEIAEWIKQIAQGLAYLHDRSIVHGDLKTENVLLNDEGNVMLADFGWSLKIGDDTVWKGRAEVEGDMDAYGSCGTPVFRAPEIVSHDLCGTKVDLWALGVVMYDLLVGELPFKDEKVFKNLHIPDHVDGEAKDLILRLLTIDPEYRISAKDVLCHPWVQGNF